MEIDFKKVGDKIRDARTAKKLTQENLAEQTNLSVTHISAIENASSKFSVDALVEISEALNISIDWLLLGDNEENLYIEHQVNRTLSDCSEREVRFLLNLLQNCKLSLREYQIPESISLPKKKPFLKL